MRGTVSCHEYGDATVLQVSTFDLLMAVDGFTTGKRSTLHAFGLTYCRINTSTVEPYVAQLLRVEINKPAGLAKKTVGQQMPSTS